jgi:protein SCO1/2
MIQYLLPLLLAVGIAAPFDPFNAAGIDRRPGAQVPLERSFTDENGRAASLRDWGEGKPVLLVPVLHRCPNLCGVTLSGLAQAIAAQPFIPGRDFVLVAFGIDPAEGPDAAKESLDGLEARFPGLPRSGIHALTGKAEDIAAVTGALGYRYAWDDRIGQYAHVAATAVLSADGHLSRWLYGLAPEPTDLRLALTEAGEGRVGGWTDQLLLLCYHFDPATGRYDSLVGWMLRIGGAGTVLGGGAWIAFAIRRERRRPAGGAPS